MKQRKWLPALLLAVVLVGGGVLLLWQTGFFSSLGSLEEMRAYIDRFAPFSQLFYFFIQFLSVVAAPIPSNVTALAGAVLFGMWEAFLLTWLAVVAGSVLVFWLARVIGQPFVERLVSRKVAEKSLAPGDHGTTYGGNPFATAAVSAVYDIFEEEHITDHVKEVGAYLYEKLEELKAEYSQITDHRGLGLMQGLEFSGPVGDIIVRAMDKGLILMSAGANVLRFVPPLVITKEHVDEMCGILRSVLTA